MKSTFRIIEKSKSFVLKTVVNKDTLLQSIRDLGYTVEKDIDIEDDKARDLAIALSGKPNFLAGISDNASDVYDQGIEPGIYYKYLTGGYGPEQPNWRGWNSPDGVYVDMVIAAAQRNGAIPMFTYFQLASELSKKNYGIFTHPNMKLYLQDLKVMFERIASFDIPAIVQLEPDFFGYMQGENIDLVKTKVNLHYDDFQDFKDFTENPIGLMQGIVAMCRKIAPKVKIGYHVSRWASWWDTSIPIYDLETKANDVADFLLRLGADKTDFVTIETLDRDAGYKETMSQGEYYWDETNETYPNFAQYFEWVEHVSARMNLPVLWWQLPLGVPSKIQGGTREHYRDNRVRYFFKHVQELIDCGSFGMVFGAGATGQTLITTDEYQFRDAMREHNKNPKEIK